jgi:hypothetical protein
MNTRFDPMSVEEPGFEEDVVAHGALLDEVAYSAREIVGAKDHNAPLVSLCREVEHAKDLEPGMSLRPVIPDVDMEFAAIRQDATLQRLGDDLARRRLPRKLQELTRATDKNIGTGFELATRHVCLQVAPKILVDDLG